MHCNYYPKCKRIIFHKEFLQLIKHNKYAEVLVNRQTRRLKIIVRECKTPTTLTLTRREGIACQIVSERLRELLPNENLRFNLTQLYDNVFVAEVVNENNSVPTSRSLCNG